MLHPKLIEKIRKYFADKPISKVYLFGSYARGEERRGSDVDLLVEMIEPNDISLFDWIEMEENLRSIVRKKIDMVNALGISKYIKPFVEKDKILIYERNMNLSKSIFLVLFFYCLVNNVCVGQSEKPHHIILFKAECERLKKDSLFSFENDTLSIKYDLWNEQGELCFTIKNSSKVPIFCDWGYSMFYPHTEHSSEYHPYWKEFKYVVNGHSILETPPNGIITSIPVQSRIEMIPPKATIDVCTIEAILNECTLNTMKTNISISPYLFNDNVYILKQAINQNNALFSFRNFITLSFDRDFKSPFYLDHTFDVKKVIEMPLNTFRETKHQFFSKKTSFYKYLDYWDSFDSNKKELKNYKQTSMVASPY